MPTSIADSLQKQVVLLLVAIYSLGVIVVNFYLAEYGMAGQISLLRPIYLLAGSYAMLPIAIGFLFFYLAPFTLQRGHRWVKALALVLLASAVALCVRVALREFNFYMAEDFPLKWDPWMWTHLILALALGGYLYMVTLGPWKVSEQSQPTSYTLMVVPGLLIWLIYSYAFSVRIYNRIPPAWGGVKPRSVELIIDPSNKELQDELKEVGVKFYTDTTRTKNTKLLIQTENDFICSVKQFKSGQTVVSTLLLKREDIKGIKYHTYRY
jgi:hypothetical protein